MPSIDRSSRRQARAAQTSMASLLSLALACDAQPTAPEHPPTYEPLVVEQDSACTVAMGEDSITYTYVTTLGDVLTLYADTNGSSGTLEHDGVVAAAFQATIGKTHNSVQVDYLGDTPVKVALTVDGQQWATGTIDGHEIVPFQASAVDESFVPELADGTLPTMPESEALLRNALQELGAKDNGCVLPTGEQTSQTLPPHAPTSFEPSPSCQACQERCAISLPVCLYASAIGCGVLSLIPFVGPGLWFICTAAATAICFGLWGQACLADCRAPGRPCCPVGCGSGCCAAAESCHPTSAMCCPATSTPCTGPMATCRTSSETCLADGSACPNTRLCGSGPAAVCCGPGMVCESGACVVPCNTMCGENCCGPNQYCFDFANSICAESIEQTCIDMGLQWCPGLGGQLCCETCLVSTEGVAYCG